MVFLTADLASVTMDELTGRPGQGAASALRLLRTAVLNAPPVAGTGSGTVVRLDATPMQAKIIRDAAEKHGGIVERPATSGELRIVKSIVPSDD